MGLRKATPEEKAIQKSAALIAGASAVTSFGYIFYRFGDILRSLVVAVVVFIVLFWVVMRGKTLENKQKH